MFSKATVPLNCPQSEVQLGVTAPPREVPFSSVSIPRLVSRYSALRPEAVAVRSGSEVLTYAELDQRANRLARFLVSEGVTTDTPVGLHFKRSLGFVIAALAVLKAGGAYVPLDSSNPVDRILFMVRDSQIPMVLTGSRVNLQLATSSDSFRIHLVEDAGITEDTGSDVCAEISPDDLAYIIYTSGSTGHPKGVEITHRGLANLVRWYQDVFSVTSADRASQVANLGFDATVWEIWPYLAAGASLNLADDLTCKDAVALRDWILVNDITISFVPTPIAERMLLLEWPSSTALRALLTGGDKLHHCPQPGLPFSVYNNYGPTESTVVATSGLVAPTADRSIEPSIGRPIDNTQIHILDENRNPASPGTVGEIYIGGASIARGYRNRPELNSTRFISDGFSEIKGARLYRTGDLGCYLPNGEIAFRGRVDDQIKLRGYRIEPNEIVVTLSHHPSVEASAVALCDGALGAQQLVAYVVMANGSRVTGTELREFLRTQLPEYMIPSSFITVDNLPLTPNGKIDRKKLSCATAATLLPEGFVAPATPTQEKLLAIITSLLRARDISTNDNFFLIGGHSLLGAQLIAKVKETFGVELSLLKLFENGTVDEMAAEIERLRAQEGNGVESYGASNSSL
jgi:amino acid adenylation domain-containing protein